MFSGIDCTIGNPRGHSGEAVNRQANEKWAGGIREVLQQLFVLGVVGSLLVLVPLHSKSAGLSSSMRVEKPARRDTNLIEAPEGVQLEDFVSWLTRSNRVGESRGQGEGN